MGDASNIRMGTCKIIYDGVDLGLTIGGVEVTVETTTKEIKVDQFGDTVASEYIMGRQIMVKVPMAETTVENMNSIMPGSVLTGPEGASKVEVRSGVNTNLLDAAKVLILRPVEKVDEDTPDGSNDDKSEDLTVWKAATPGAASFAYKYNEERILNAEFKGYVDTANNNRIFTYGDPDIT